jgi:hypothetical protein
MNEQQRTEYELLKKVCNEIDFRINRINKAINNPDIPTTSFNFLLGSKIELQDLKITITNKLAEYRKTIFQTKKTQENEQA